MSLTGLNIENQINKLADDPSHPHLNDFYTHLITKQIGVSKLDIYFNFGLKDDACITALTCGLLETLSAIIISYILNYNKTAQVLKDIRPNYYENQCELSVQASLQISLKDMIISYFKAKKMYKDLIKENQNGTK